MMRNDVKVGNIIKLDQKNGCCLMIHIYEDGIGVKADHPGTLMEVQRDSTFWVRCTAVDKPKKPKKPKTSYRRRGYMMLCMVVSLLICGCTVHHVRWYENELEAMGCPCQLKYVPIFDCGPDRICIPYLTARN